MKFIGFALVCAFILFGCDTATNPDDTQPPGGGETPVKIYALGETGPGGGTIFYTDSTGAYREVSAVLGTNVTWADAKKQAEDHTNDGYSDWYLPTPAELNQLYKSEKVAKDVTLWSSEEWDYWTVQENDLAVKPAVFYEAWVYNFVDRTRSHQAKSDGYSVRAVRSYNPKTYSVGNTGPGGGKIFWVSEDKKSYKEVSQRLGGDSATYNWYEASGSADENHNSNGDTNIAGNYNGGGCNDWYLPDAIELNEVYKAMETVTIDITEGYLWSSVEAHNAGAWWQYFRSGNQTLYDKTMPGGVRAIRAFNTSAP